MKISSQKLFKMMNCFYFLIIVFAILSTINCSPSLEFSACSQAELMACGKPIMSKFTYEDEKSLCCATLSLKPCFDTLSIKCLNAFAEIIHNIPQYSAINNGQEFNSRTREEIDYCNSKYSGVC